MTPEEFVIWLKGFVVASSHYNLTPAAWEALREQLSQVRTATTSDEDDVEEGLLN